MDFDALNVKLFFYNGENCRNKPRKEIIHCAYMCLKCVTLYCRHKSLEPLYPKAYINHMHIQYDRVKVLSIVKICHSL